MLKVELLNENAIIPTMGTEKAFGYDVSACLKGVETVPVWFDDNHKTEVQVKELDGEIGFWLEPHGRACVPTGLRFHIDDNYGVIIAPRSGISLKRGLNLANCVGIIDADYTHEVGITLTNTTRQRQFIKHGERLCQAFVMKREKTDAIQVVGETKAQAKQKEPSKRNGGFGSTGTEAQNG